MNQENHGTGLEQPQKTAEKGRRRHFAWIIFLRTFIAINIFGGGAALAEQLGLTHSDKPNILIIFLVYLLAGVIYSLQTGLRDFRIGRLLACALLAWMAVDIFTTATACLAFLLVPMLLVTIIAGLVLRYPQPPETPRA
jgi:hypothetical protein